MTNLQIKQMEKIAEKKVYEVLSRVSGDPDFGLELRPEFIKELKKSIASEKAGRVKKFEDVVKNLK